MRLSGWHVGMVLGLFALATTAAPPEPEFSEPRDFFLYLRRSAPALAETAGSLQESWPAMRRAALQELKRAPSPSYVPLLKSLLEVPPPEEPVADPASLLDFSQAPRRLVRHNERLLEVEGSLSGDEWRNELAGLHRDYSHSLVAVYVALEMAKRAHLLPTSEALLFGPKRERLLVAMEQTHRQAQALMESFRILRTHRLLAGLMPYTKKVWEDRHGNAFHFRIVLNFRPSDGVYLARDIGPYFSALEEGEVSASPAKNVEALQMRYRELLKLLEPDPRNDVLRRELYEVIAAIRAHGVEPKP